MFVGDGCGQEGAFRWDGEVMQTCPVAGSSGARGNWVEGGPASLWGAASVKGAGRCGEAPRPCREGGQGKPSADPPGWPDLPTSGGAVKECRSQSLLPQSPAPGARGNRLGPSQVVAEGIAGFALKSLWSDLSAIGCRYVRHRDSMKAQTDLIEEK